jgi:ABC-type multidrug transport system ATPase subunit
MSASAIEFQGVRKSFGLAFSLGSLTLSVPRGSIYALIGPNGAGKSTALNMLMGMGEPTLGSIRVLDRDIRHDEVEIKRRTAYVSPDMDYRALRWYWRCLETRSCWCWMSPHWVSMPSRAVSCSQSCSNS